MDARLSVDIGGTFTDLALEFEGQRVTAKTLTVPANPEEGVMNGVHEILELAGLAPCDISLLVHGTTLITNALIERRGAKTALVTTRGFRDVLETGAESRYDQYDLNIQLPEPLVPRALRLPVEERIDRDGNILLDLNVEDVLALVPKLKAEGVEAVAIGTLHSYRNPAHELAIHAILSEALPEIAFSLSSQVSPQMREWERFSTTVANAYVQPIMRRYLRKLESRLKDIGLDAPVLMMLSGGSLCTIDTACDFPIRLVESGPAGGAIFAAEIARQCGCKDVLSFDMGGTTAKICLIDGFEPHHSRDFEVARVGRFKKGSGLPVRVPVIEMVEIGAGGGSIAQIDRMGRIQIGPKSAASDPGPICYGRGGTQATVTDANLTLGRYEPSTFAGGRIALDQKGAEAGLERDIGSAMKVDGRMAALGVIEMVDENMSNAARVHAIESGTSYEGRTLIAFGGGGPVHAYRVAEKLGIGRILIPTGAGVGSAIGFLRAPVGYEVFRSLYQRLDALDLRAVNELFVDMESEANAVVYRASFGARIERKRQAFMRYTGQGHEIALSLPDRPLVEADIERLRQDYTDAYARAYDRTVPGSAIEIVNFSITVAVSQEILESRLLRAERGNRATPASVRAVTDTHNSSLANWSIYDRADLKPSDWLSGPAIIAEVETSTLVGPEWTARINEHSYIELERKMA